MLAKIFSRFWRNDDGGSRFADQWVGRGLEALGEGDAAAARAAFESALSCDDSHLAAMVNLGHVLREHAGEYALAATHYEAALVRDPALHDVRVQLGACMYELGDADAALRCFNAVLERDPGHIDAGQHALFSMNALSGVTPEQLFLAHRQWARRHADPLVRLPREAPRQSGGRIRLAYLSGDLRDHATLAFVEPLLAHHDRARFDIACYASSPVRDAATRRLSALDLRWHDVHGMDDASLAARIHADGVDVLVDLSGHTRDNRLLVFARKPAPVQVAWLGYLRTTGLAALDYRLSDAAADPVGLSDAVHSERVVRLPGALWAFSAHTDAPEPVPRTPDARISFGSFNHPAKLSEPVLSSWAALLLRVPSSKLVLAGVPPGPGRERIAAAMKKAGVDPVRLKFHARVPRREFWQLIADTDVALDPFPYNGGATTCDCLWQGVPVVTLAGDGGFARSGASLLKAAGFPEWIAASPEEYIDQAAGLSQDRAGLAELRSGLRGRLGVSALCDLPGFARRFEDAIIEIWRGECA
jgi:predicted O-linked N-acetylglucosamine transferase (SPINDLY family)